MAKSPAPKPTEDTRPQPPIEGEVVSAEEVFTGASALVARNSDLDASLAIALSESEIDKQIQTAHRFPRSVQRALNQIVELATLDTPTAMECNYSLPRGKDGGRQKFITGPSIRLAELVAQQWGNNRSSARVIATDRKEKFIEAEGIYHDLETNSAVCARVRRRISDSKGRLYNDDMIVMTGNAAASIALRNAILRGIPKPIWRRAYDAVVKVIHGDEKTLGARRVELLTRFKEDLGIKPSQVYVILGVGGEQDVGFEEMVQASGFYTALKNNEVTVEDLLRDAGGTAAPKTLSQAYQGGHVTGDTIDDDGVVIEKSTAGAGEKIDKATPVAQGAPQTAEAPKAADATPTPTEAAQPAPKAEEKPVPRETSDDYPAPGSTYMLSTDKWENGLKAAYVDGVRKATAGKNAGLPEFTRHAPTEVREVPGHGQGSEAATPSIRANPEDRSEPEAEEGPFAQFTADIEAADCWNDIKAAVTVLSGTPEYEADPDEADNSRRLAVLRYQQLAAEGKETIEVHEDPHLFSLWLEVAPADEVRPAFRKLIRLPVYTALADDSKDAIAEAVTGAESRG